MRIENTYISELDDAYKLFQKVIRFHRTKNHPVWPDISTSSLLLDIKQRRQFKIALSNEILALFSVFVEDAHIWGERCRKDAI